MNSTTNPVLTEENLRLLVEYWRSIARGAAVPLRRDFEPMAIPLLLPDVYLVELMRPERRFRYRLVGTRVAEKAGFDATGCILDELSCGTTMAFVIRLLERCVDLHCPVASLSSFGRAGKANLIVRRVFLPLTLGRGPVDQILCGQTFDHTLQPMPSGREIDRSSPMYRDLAASTPDAEHEYFDI
ncbi:PAS domain-containing protein [Pelagibius sp. Alg239-R121]|uniref:PAS domain-containing protein n=1 Tax=Pelagibius sp. Alg239-R121 TaxID=2993448 RepID=UPI0024A710F7|nr:PAS domain-containing protein [Pelagibius sp. Alg239-R121]